MIDVTGRMVALAIMLLSLSISLPAAGIPLVARAAPQPYFAAFGTWGVNSTAIAASPGSSDLPLTVELVYEGPLQLYNVSATLEPSYPLVSVRGQGNVSEFVPVLEPGNELRLVGFFNVSRSAQVGVYNETIHISYVELAQVPGTGAEVALSGSEDVNFSVPILGHSDVRMVGFTTYPPVIYAGDAAGELEVILVNYGNAAAEGVNVTVNFGAPLAPLYPGSNSAFIAYMPPGEPVNLTFPFSIGNATESVLVYPLGYLAVPEPMNSTATLNVSYTAGSSEIDIPIEIAPSAHFIYTEVVHGSTASGASDSYVTVTLLNAGGAEAKYATVTLLTGPVFSPYAPSSENPIIAAESINYSLGNVAPGSVVNFTYLVDIASGLRPGTYYLPLLVTWYQPPTMQQMHQVIEVPISVVAPFSLTSLSALRANDAASSIAILYSVSVAVIVVLIAMVFVGRRRRS
ncbi:MAG: COG1361 S-layer family protein [Conexivisphaera sp.]